MTGTTRGSKVQGSEKDDLGRPAPPHPAGANPKADSEAGGGGSEGQGRAFTVTQAAPFSNLWAATCFGLASHATYRFRRETYATSGGSDLSMHGGQGSYFLLSLRHLGCI